MNAGNAESRPYDEIPLPRSDSELPKFAAAVDRHAERLREDGYPVLAELALLERDFIANRVRAHSS